MTHTLHRRGNEEGLQKDYVVFCMTAQQFNGPGSAPVFRKFFEIVNKYNPNNIGDCSQGSCKLHLSYDEMLAGVRNNTVAHGVFSDRDTVIKVLEELKAAELGPSVVISALDSEVDEIARITGIKVHTRHASLGIHGNTARLPDEDHLEVGTMCGHGLISYNLISHLAKKYKAGKITALKAAEEVAKQCTCGVVNIPRAEYLIKKIADSLE